MVARQSKFWALSPDVTAGTGCTAGNCIDEITAQPFGDLLHDLGIISRTASGFPLKRPRMVSSALARA